jgi:hypothetical protein
MTESYPEDLLREEVELKLPVYQDYTEEQLLAEISQLELGSQLETGSRLEGIDRGRCGIAGGYCSHRRPEHAAVTDLCIKV